MLKQFTLLFLPYVQKTPIILHALCSKKSIVLLPVLALPLITTHEHILLFLFGLVVFDFATGIAVSSSEKTKAEIEAKNRSTKEYEILKSQRLITSKKLKQTGVKVMLYISSLLVAYWFDSVLKIEHFHFRFSGVDYTVTLIVALWWVVVEIYSIFFENFKDLGFDILKVFTKMKEVYMQFKKAKNEI